MPSKWIAVEHRSGGWDVMDGERKIATMLPEADAKRIAASEPLPPENAHPLVHFNGTSAPELLELREVAYSAIWEALEALKKMAPNGRDYYLEDGRMARAEETHRRRMAKLTTLMAELERECELIQAQTR